MNARAPKLFVGVGNILRGDDGIGVRVAQVLSSLPLPEDVEVYDAGTLGFEVAGVLEGREQVVVVDAVEAGAKPGAIFRFTPDSLRPYIHGGLSLHEVHLLSALEETRLLGTAPRHVIIFSVQTNDVSVGIGLSAIVEESLERVLELVVQELGLPVEILEHAVRTASPW